MNPDYVYTVYEEGLSGAMWIRVPRSHVRYLDTDISDVSYEDEFFYYLESSVDRQIFVDAYTAYFEKEPKTTLQSTPSPYVSSIRNKRKYQKK